MRAVLLIPLLSVSLAAGGISQATAPQNGAELRVGTKVAPPFAIKEADGSWRGIAIDLWRDVARGLGRTPTFVERESVDELLAGLGTDYEAAVAALTVTAAREEKFDFTHPFHAAGLGIAVSATAAPGLVDILERFPLLGFARVLGGLLLTLFVVGVVIWLLERRRNREQFERGAPGLGSGLWWSAVTMTTVGYGDKSPRTLGGRSVAIVWMFLSIFMISAFTATVASTLTAASLDSSIRGPRDLARVRVAAVRDATAHGYLIRNRIVPRGKASLTECLGELSAGRVDAVVHDGPILKYLVQTEFAESLRVLPASFEVQQYTIALPDGSPLRERVNRALLRLVETNAWQELLARYMSL